MKLYIYDNALLGESGTEFNDASNVDCINCDSEGECIAKFDDNYGSNDFTASFTKHE